ncbi:site-specific DNA-methyltransferase [Paracoccus chinensis]|uniref:site-specific DNA-methyltransferase (adenine-specific) n=1 Tax=Paracoccus chinensis TaxID=525640 RepID=A0A1G9NB25_9RHOB|nr:site-specific DNA-methyltransferase [Paracoccus chinensis]SDL83317.1 adenine-specific DNA-methyltransferase [Paracoccus chinensis]
MTAIKKLDLNDPDTRSADIVAGNVEALKALFPEAFKEGAIDFDVLKQLLGEAVDEREEKYGLNWHGKRKARQIALTPSTGTLLPCPEESVNWDTTQNLMIEGDNLEVLKLLQKSYNRKVKAIYIDPPYNTGRNLIYPNDYQDGIKAYLEITGQTDGNLKLTSNPDTGGRFHTNWLSMMYPRLKLARNLLAEDGVLIATIDDNEVTQLGMILKEVFEEGSYDHVCVPVVHNPRGVQGKNFSYVHEYAFFVFPAGAKAIADRNIDSSEIEWTQFRNWGTESERTDAKNCFYPVLVKDGQIVGFGDVTGDDIHPRQTEIDGELSYIYPIDRSGVERKWRYARQSVEAIRHLLRAKPTKSGYEIELGKNFGLYKTVWTDKRYDANEYGTGIVGNLVPGSPFTFPKSLWAVYDSILAATANDDNAIVLDFFAGSGTTAHAVLELNKDRGGNRRFIMVQFPEPTEDKDFISIFDVTKARVKAAGTKIKLENPTFTGDTGFRVFKLASSNIRAWEPDAANLEDSLLKNAEHVVQGRTETDVLYELLLKLGLDLCVPIERREIDGKAVHAIGGGVLIVCLADGLSEDVVEPLSAGIVAWHKELAPAVDTRVVFKDSGFADDIAKTNMAAILNQNGITDVRSL